MKKKNLTGGCAVKWVCDPELYNPLPPVLIRNVAKIYVNTKTQ